MSGLKIKVNCDDDMRLFRSNSPKFDELLMFIEKTWNLGETKFIMTFEDEEGDTITLANQLDLDEAIKFAIDEDRKSLKIYVLYQKLSENAKNENEEIENEKQDKVEEKEKEKEAVFETDEEMVLDLITNHSQLLIELFGDILTRLVENGPLNERQQIVDLITEIINTSNYAPIRCRKYSRLLSLVIPYAANRVFGQQSLYVANKDNVAHFKLDTKKSWLKDLLEMLGTAISQSHLLKDIVIDIQYPVKTDNNEWIHFGVACDGDGCNQYPIIGNRFKCSVRPDTDFCEKCMQSQPETHPLIMIRRPLNKEDDTPFHGFAEIMTKKVEVKDNDDDDNQNDVELEVDCICGSKMQSVVAKDAYSDCKYVVCDGCNSEYLNEQVQHCPLSKSCSIHSNGYDLCHECAVIKAAADKLKDAQIEQEENDHDDQQEPEKEEEPENQNDEPEIDQNEPEIEEAEIAEPAPPAPSAPIVSVIENEQPIEFEFDFQEQLNFILEMGIEADQEKIKILLIENNGNVESVVPILFSQFIP